MSQPTLLHQSAQADIYYLPGAQATVYMANEPMSATTPQQPATTPANPQKEIRGGGSQQVQLWGAGNNFPQEVHTLYSRDPIIPETFSKKVSMINMSEVIPVQVMGYNADETEQVEPVNDDEIFAFLENTSNRRYLTEAATDLVWFANAFPELILSKDRSKVLYIQHQEAMYARYEAAKSGKVELLHLNANWPNVKDNDPLTVKRRLIDPYQWDRIEYVRSGMKDYSFIYPINIPSPGRDYYQLANHDSIRTSGWLDIHLSVPEFKKAMMANEMSIKYHIKVDSRYWELLHGKPEWAAMTADGRLAKKKEWLTAMNKDLTDVQNAGKSILTERVWVAGDRGGTYMDYVEITTVTESMKEGKYLADGLEAAANIFYALGMDPTIVGFAGGDKMGSRSGGSDKREAWLIVTNLLKQYRDPLLEPYYFAAEYNGWKVKYPRLKFRHRNVILTTLDTNAGTKKVLS